MQLMVAENIEQKIVREISAWPDVTVAPHRFGGVEFRVGRRELGHLHGSRWADLPFPVRVRDELIAEGRAERHHVLPESGWVSVRIRNAGDAANVVELFRMDYDRACKASKSPVKCRNPKSIMLRSRSTLAVIRLNDAHIKVVITQLTISNSPDED